MAANMRFMIKGWVFSPLLLVIFCTFFDWFSHALDTIIPGEKLMDNDTLVSAGGVFELGFFQAGVSSNYYLGIWFKNDRDKKPVWVANREIPLLDSSGLLQIRYDGNLCILDRRMIPIIVNYGELATNGNTTATILDSGNFVLREGEKIVWQSFNYPSDTFLPGMKLGWFNLNTHQLRKQFIVSWLSPIVPTTGAFALGLDKIHLTQFTLWRRDGVYRQVGFWDGQSFRFFLQSSSISYNFSYVSNENETYLTFDSKENYTQWFVVESSGQIVEFSMSGRDISIVNHSLCTSANDSKGCLISGPSMCSDGDTFTEINGSMPNSILVNGSVQMGPSDCEIMCRSNCSCTAFASFRNDGTGCKIYYGEKDGLLDMIGKGDGVLYVRGDIPTKPNHRRKRRLLLAVIGSVVSLVVLIVVTLLCYLQWRNHKHKGQNERSLDGMSRSAELLFSQLVNSTSKLQLGGKKDYELPLFSFSTIATATGNFSAADKLGEGGFGPVYKVISSSAWDLWQEGRGLELMDPTLNISCSMAELLLYLQVGLLCVQENAEDRPNMSDVVSMLSNGTPTLPAPKKPAFSTHIRAVDADLQKPHSLDDVTVSEIEGR
ncbi:hypothetical protein HHK36_021493 [Tetracentron sinense]|uniref:non-specific serine/threonine protein kinase n=1 Tax=Tetracentron sinense TaxID=13715 RepID=A0A834YRM4_TETSI|nr:hypothetical protein HHK36_021493 [Tetracentron sinense]